MPQLLCRTSMFHLAGSTTAHQSSLKRVGAHAERFVEPLWNMEPDDLDGSFPTLEHALEYLGWVASPPGGFGGRSPFDIIIMTCTLIAFGNGIFPVNAFKQGVSPVRA